MASSVDICNDALRQLGARPITSLDDDSTEAQVMKALYPLRRDELLEDFDWRFATVRLELAADVDEPVSDWGYSYTLPSTVLRVLRCDDGSSEYAIDWEVEGRKIMAGISGPLYVVAIQRVEDTSIFPPGFRAALSAWIAADACTPLTENEAKTQRLLQVAAMKTKMAQNRDGGQGRTRVTTANDITSARY